MKSDEKEHRKKLSFYKTIKNEQKKGKNLSCLLIYINFYYYLLFTKKL